MIAPDLTTLCNSLALLVIAIAQKLGARRERRNNTVTRKQIAGLEEKMGPVTVALKELALARETIANLTQRDTDILSAVDARKRLNLHEMHEAMREKMKQEDIAKFKTQKPHPPFIPLLGLLLCVCSGCTPYQVRWVHEVAQSNAAGHLHIQTIWATVDYDRANPGGTNAITVGGPNGITTR